MDPQTFSKIARLRKGSEGALQDVLSEIGTERAETLTRLGRRLEQARARIDAAAGLPDAERAEADREARRAFLAARWELLVVKEAMGLRGVRAEIERDWPLPPPA